MTDTLDDGVRSRRRRRAHGSASAARIADAAGGRTALADLQDRAARDRRRGRRVRGVRAVPAQRVARPRASSPPSTILVNWIYFSRKQIPAKYLTPGIILLIVFQIFTLVYTGYIGFTNYGTGHNGSKDQAVASLMRSSLVRVEDSPTFDVTVVERVGELGLLVTDPTDGDVSLGTNLQPLRAGRRRHDGGRQGRRRRRLDHAHLRRRARAQQRHRGARRRRTATTRTTARSARRTARRATCTSRPSSTTRPPTP